jgi:hypothetical protein
VTLLNGFRTSVEQRPHSHEGVYGLDGLGDGASDSSGPLAARHPPVKWRSSRFLWSRERPGPSLAAGPHWPALPTPVATAGNDVMWLSAERKDVTAPEPIPARLSSLR